MKNEERRKERSVLRLRLEVFRALYHVMAVFTIGLSMIPAAALLYGSWHAFDGRSAAWRIVAISFALPVAYFLFGFALMLTGCALKSALRLGLKPGVYRIYEDWEVIRWMGYNTFVLVVNACFIDGFRVSPLQALFYRMMGAKVGDGAEINTSGLADLELLEIGSNTIVGGGTTLICHAAERGLLRLAPVRIGSGVSIGIDSIIMPGCEVGDGAVIAPRSLLPPGTKIPARGHFGGDPLRDLKAERRAKGASKPEGSLE